MPGPAITGPVSLVISGTGVTEVDITPSESTTLVHTVLRLEMTWSVNTTVEIVARESLAAERALTGVQPALSSLVRDYTAEFPWYSALKDEKIVAKFGASVNVGGASLVKSKTVPV